jgi:hypothetical protein
MKFSISRIKSHAERWGGVVDEVVLGEVDSTDVLLTQELSGQLVQVPGDILSSSGSHVLARTLCFRKGSFIAIMADAEDSNGAVTEGPWD